MGKTTFITVGPQETRDTGRQLASRITNGMVLALFGDLGAGKTTFVQGLAEGLGTKRRIISPTFVIVRSYKLETRKSKLFYHIDLYRIQGKYDLNGLGIKEIINNPQNIVVIEWADKIDPLLPKKRFDVHFEYISHSKRKIITRSLK